MDETQGSPEPPGGDEQTSPAETSGPSRRTVLAGAAAALLVGGGVGVGAGFVRGSGSGPTTSREPLPGALRDAVADERTLLAGARSLEAADRTDVARLIVRDHQAHLAALLAAAEQYTSPRQSGAPTASRHTPVDRAAQRSLEQRAARQASARAERLIGAPAALLASIAACEATHGVLLEQQ